MANLPTRFVLFLSSYIPLWVIFGLVTIKNHRYVGVCFFILALASGVATMLFLRAVQSLQGTNVTVRGIHRRDAETMSYIASYVIPFATTSLGEPAQLVSLIVFMSVLCLVYVNSAMIHINPLLTIVGYRLYEIEDANGDSLVIISKNRLRRGEVINAVDVAEGILVSKER